MTTTPVSDQAGVSATRGRIPVDSFAARLKLARLDAGNLTIREAAARCGLNFASWSNWEGGMAPRRIDRVAQKISDTLGIDRDWLLYGGPLAKENEDRSAHAEEAAGIPNSSYVGAVLPLSRANTAPAGTHPRGRGDSTRPRETYAAAAA